MKIAAIHSHYGGLRYLKKHYPNALDALEFAVHYIDAEEFRTKRCREKRGYGQMLYSPSEINAEMRHILTELGWRQAPYQADVTTIDPQLSREIIGMELGDKKRLLKSIGAPVIHTGDVGDFMMDRVQLEVQFGKYPFVVHDIHQKFLLNYKEKRIDVGIEVLPTMAMAGLMSSGVPVFERERHKLLNLGGRYPPVRVVMVGIEP